MENIKNLFKGRLGRLHYFLGSLIVLGVGMLFMFIYLNAYLSFFFTILTLPITVRRLHDIGLPGFLAPIGWLSYLGGGFIAIAVVFNFGLYIIPGSKQANKYDEAPRPGLKFLDAILGRRVKNEISNHSLNKEVK